MNMTFGQWDLGDILRHTFTIYGRNLWRFVAIVAVVMVPLGILCGSLPLLPAWCHSF